MNYLKVGMLACALFIFSCGILSAQAPEDKNLKKEIQESNSASNTSIILNLGVGFPSGDYADVETGGGAMKGFNIGVEFQYNITPSFYVEQCIETKQTHRMRKLWK